MNATNYVELLYVDNTSRNLYFKMNNSGLVFRSIETFEIASTEPVSFEWEIFGLAACGQDRQKYINHTEKMLHPLDCVLDIPATINLLRYKLIHKSLLSNLRQSKLN